MNKLVVAAHTVFGSDARRISKREADGVPGELKAFHS
jgi:hypothetical protein